METSETPLEPPLPVCLKSVKKTLFEADQDYIGAKWKATQVWPYYQDQYHGVNCGTKLEIMDFKELVPCKLF